jgi:hypothetical protein
MESLKSVELVERLKMVVDNRGNRESTSLASKTGACHKAHNAILHFRGSVAIYKGLAYAIKELHNNAVSFT